MNQNDTPDQTKPTYIIRRSDGEELYGEYAFMLCDGHDDWTVAAESAHDAGPIEYEILRCVPVATRTFGVDEDDEDDDEGTPVSVAHDDDDGRVYEVDAADAS